MARPKKSRTVCFEPDITEFIKIKNNREFVEITVDEYETLRLIDYMGLTQMECALQMQVARSTIASIYESARYKISDSLVNGKAIKISGGDYNICPNSKTCCGRCGTNVCGRCNHGACEKCTGKFHPKGKECKLIS